ncbi:putative bifunctional diguanylate cyclase/phosphodiesterase [Sanguibacter antarcticus]|uniref:Diguanylate cyclase (GGDEF)-like protein n=1 Tax=Sanguibacter antarcticus TaxID=372484 RepID=A0A2A9E3C3_9MICO|nr:bifunctional diguanylate cyclase/phosphodiesterase [Sanguibacter antarcticus]PFG33527.1 diguanylate cyclase (GGDEF)-like protein [Sanguibacter antarcticus]
MVTTDPREASCATTKLLLTYVRAQGGDGAVARVIEQSGVEYTVADLEDTSRWISHDSRLRLFSAATAVVGHDQVMTEVGAAAMRSDVRSVIVPMLRASGSSREAYRRLPAVIQHLTSVSVLRVVTSSPGAATLEMQREHEHSRLDCDYAQGLLSAVPTLWGLAPATVTHTTGPGENGEVCRFEVAWIDSVRPSTPRRRRRSEADLVALRAQMHELQVAAADLVASQDVPTVLDRIVHHAAMVTDAQAYLLVIDDVDGTGRAVRSTGLTEEREAHLAQVLLSDEPLGDDAVVVDVASSRRVHGRLVALYSTGDGQRRRSRELLEAYAHHAASALDLLTALEESRREERRAADLLALAHDLAVATDSVAVAQVLAEALPQIVGCRGSTVMQWEAALGSFRVVAAAGLEEAARDVVLSTTFRADQIPEIVGILTHHGPLLVDIRTASPVLQQVLRASGSQSVVVVPLLAGDELMGVVTAGFSGFLDGTGQHHEALARIAGMSDQGATALQNARLLATVRHQSQHDALTGLPNRLLFARLLDEGLRGASGEASTAVLFCDLDRFKHINDALGHAAGDELLRQVSARLRGELRPGDVVGRLGGDEFAILLTDIDDERQPFAVAMRLVDALDEPFRIDGREVRITASVGVAIHSGTDGRGDKLLAASDSAMYIAKQSGRNQVAISGEALARRIVPSLEAELSKAAGAGELRLHFQPVVDVSGTDDLTVVGAEALLRWHHPRLGLLAPGAFLPLAEEAGLVTDLDLWALDAACKQLAGWPATSDRPLHVAVNLASASLVDPRLVPAVRAALTTYGLLPSRLHLELVESRSLIDLPGVIERMDELRQLGVRISLDDFGTGYSTLAWLQALPVDQIKIDRSFIMQLPKHGASLAVVRGVLALARELGIEVIAEGVEEPEQLAMLREIGCELVQGFLLGRPAPELDQSRPVVGG